MIPLSLYSISLLVGPGKFMMLSAILWSACIPCCVSFPPGMLFSLERVYNFACLALARNVSPFYLKSSVVHFYCFSSDQNIIFVNRTTFCSNKNTLYFPVKRLGGQAQSNWQSEETVSQKGWWICANMGCFSKGTCQSPSDTPSLEKYLASSPSSRLSSFVDSGKCLLFFMYSDLLGQCTFYL